MDAAAENLRSLLPALAFLCAGVPLAALLDRLGYFDALAVEIERRLDGVPILALWVLAAVTTAVLNLDTTVVLLTPLYIRLARHSGHDPLSAAIVPLLLASLASSVLPISNLTTLIAVDRFGLGVGEVFVHLAPVSVAASVLGWLVYRRRHPKRLPRSGIGQPDRHAVRVGSVIVAALLCGFVFGPAFGVPPWVVALAADLVLVIITRWVPWRSVPLGTAVGVAILGVVVALVIPSDLLGPLIDLDGPGAVAGVMSIGAATANGINNLPAVVIALDSTESMSWGMWAWLGGVNTGAVLLPLGALANLLWWRIVREEGIELSVRRYATVVVPDRAPSAAGRHCGTRGHTVGDRPRVGSRGPSGSFCDSPIALSASSESQNGVGPPQPGSWRIPLTSLVSNSPSVARSSALKSSRASSNQAVTALSNRRRTLRPDLVSRCSAARVSQGSVVRST